MSTRLDPLPGVSVDEDLDHEDRQATVGRAGRIGLGVILAVALLGACGGAGPLTHAEARAGDLVVRYDRFARLDAPTDLTVALPPSDSVFTVTGDLPRDLRLDVVQPAPASEASRAGALTLTTTPGAVVRIHARPMRFGRIGGAIALPGGREARIRLVVYP